MKKITFVTVCPILFALALSASVAAGDRQATPNTITVDNFSFNAPVLTVSAGTTVTWVNQDDVPHKIVSTDKKFSSPVLDTGGRFSHTFTAPGTYEYFCSIHPTMTGKVVVKGK